MANENDVFGGNDALDDGGASLHPVWQCIFVLTLLYVTYQFLFAPQENVQRKESHNKESASELRKLSLSPKTSLSPRTSKKRKSPGTPKRFERQISREATPNPRSFDKVESPTPCETSDTSFPSIPRRKIELNVKPVEIKKRPIQKPMLFPHEFDSKFLMNAYHNSETSAANESEPDVTWIELETALKTLITNVDGPFPEQQLSLQKSLRNSIIQLRKVHVDVWTYEHSRAALIIVVIMSHLLMLPEIYERCFDKQNGFLKLLYKILTSYPYFKQWFWKLVDDEEDIFSSSFTSKNLTMLIFNGGLDPWFFDFLGSWDKSYVEDEMVLVLRPWPKRVEYAVKIIEILRQGANIDENMVQHAGLDKIINNIPAKVLKRIRYNDLQSTSPGCKLLYDDYRLHKHDKDYFSFAAYPWLFSLSSRWKMLIIAIKFRETFKISESIGHHKQNVRNIFRKKIMRKLREDPWGEIRARDLRLNAEEREQVKMERFTLNVERKDLIASTLKAMKSVKLEEIVKPLHIKFAEDAGHAEAGGISREFFTLLSQELFSLKSGLFEEVEGANTLWFAKAHHPSSHYELCGFLIGLALYNSSLIHVNLPLIFDILLGKDEFSINDFRILDPGMAKQLEMTLNYDQVEDLCLYFTIPEGDLKPNGVDILVTNENVQEFVELLVQYRIIGAHTKKIRAFRRGFNKVWGEEFRLDRSFTPKELEKLVCGTTEIDFKDLEKNAQYRGYKKSDDIIQWLWNWIHSLSPEKKIKFLYFITSSYRIPVDGLDKVQLKIEKHMLKDENARPQTLTCYYQLFLPPYKTQSKLEAMMNFALDHAKGFSQ